MNKTSLLIIIAMLSGVGVFARSSGFEKPPVSAPLRLNARCHRSAGDFFSHISTSSRLSDGTVRKLFQKC